MITFLETNLILQEEESKETIQGTSKYTDPTRLKKYSDTSFEFFSQQAKKGFNSYFAAIDPKLGGYVEVKMSWSLHKINKRRQERRKFLSSQDDLK